MNNHALPYVVVLLCALSPLAIATDVLNWSGQLDTESPLVKAQRYQQAALQNQQRQMELQQQQQAYEEQQQAYAAQMQAYQEQQQKDATLRGLAAELFQAAPEDRSPLLAQMAALDPNMALQYQQMFSSQKSTETAPAFSLFRCVGQGGSVVYTTQASAGCVDIHYRVNQPVGAPPVATTYAAANRSPVRTRGYFKRTGTYVAPSYHTAPDHTKVNNWSSKPNVNPYTGKSGTKDPYAPPRSH